MKDEGQRLAEGRACLLIGVGIVTEEADEVTRRLFRGLYLSDTDGVGDDLLKILRDVQCDGDRRLSHGGTSLQGALTGIRAPCALGGPDVSPCLLQKNGGFGRSLEEGPKPNSCIIALNLEDLAPERQQAASDLLKEFTYL
jgi:hypothetical protein